jgi:5-methylcytosine-specific restriction enzyme A
MTGRTVPEWVATHPDQAIPTRVKLRIFQRYEGRCALTGVKLLPGTFDFDHERPLSMNGEHREGNLRPVLRTVHRQKTADEAGPRAKADRIYLKANGLWPKSKRPLQGRGFPKRGEAR